MIHKLLVGVVDIASTVGIEGKAKHSIQSRYIRQSRYSKQSSQCESEVGGGEMMRWRLPPLPPPKPTTLHCALPETLFSIL